MTSNLRLPNPLIIFLLLAASMVVSVVPAHADACSDAARVTLSGVLRGSNGAALQNGTLTLTPSATGYIPACGVNLASAITCATSTDGSVVGLPNPLTQTLATAQYGVGTLPAANYFVVYTFYDADGNQTLASPEFQVQLTGAGTLNVSAPASGVPSSAVGMKVYIGTTSGTETLQGSTVGQASYAQSVPLVAGAALPSTNSTICKVTANDAMWPYGTGYVVSLLDSSGNAIPKFQQQWQLNGPGSTINLSSGLPYYHGVIYYPTPLLSSPTNHGNQSISGPLNMTGYNLVNVGRFGAGTALPGYTGDFHGDLNFTGTLRINGSGGILGQCPISQGPNSAPIWTTCGVGPAYYQSVQSNGSTVTQRSVINFSSRFSVADNGGSSRTDVDLPATGVSAGSYTNASITVDAYGRLTAASNGAAPVAYASLPACNGGIEGIERAVTDSNTTTWGAAIAGGSSNHVLAYCNGSAWTVAAK